MPVKPMPDGYHTVTTSLLVDGAGKLIDFMEQAFSAKQRLRMPMPDGSVAHAELTIGDSVVMVSDATAQYPAGQGFIHLYVEDVDGTYRKALAAAGRPVLRRPLRRRSRRVRQSLVARHAHRGRVGGRDDAPHGRNDGRGVAVSGYRADKRMDLLESAIRLIIRGRPHHSA